MSLSVSAPGDRVPLGMRPLDDGDAAGSARGAAESGRMQFLVITRRLTEKFTDAEFAELLDAEAAHARDLYARGVFRTLHSRGDIPGAVITVEADTAGDATALVNSLPFAQHKMMEFEVVPLLPYRGFVV